MNNLWKVLCLFVSFSVKLCFSENDYEGSKCQNLGNSGRCRRVRDCPIALHSLKHGFSHDLKRCGWDGKVEILCCPEAGVREPSFESSTFGIGEVWTDDSGEDKSTSSNRVDGNDLSKESRVTNRRCEQECEDYTKGLKPAIDFHIFGGEAASAGEFPHMAALGFQSDEGNEVDWKRCGASLISMRFLLTAAHCFINIQRPVVKKALLGAVDLSSRNRSTWQEYEVLNYTVHPNYDTRSKLHDIALVKLNRDIQITDSVRPACLYTKNDDPLGLLVTGWGKTSLENNDDRSSKLQKAKLKAVSIQQCNVTYFKTTLGSRSVFSSQICAWANSSDACWGDSGGPLQIRTIKTSYAIVGIVSYGAGCGGKSPGVYTRVSQYLDWIESLVWPG